MARTGVIRPVSRTPKRLPIVLPIPPARTMSATVAFDVPRPSSNLADKVRIQWVWLPPWGVAQSSEGYTTKQNCQHAGRLVPCEEQ